MTVAYGEFRAALDEGFNAPQRFKRGDALNCWGRGATDLADKLEVAEMSEEVRGLVRDLFREHGQQVGDLFRASGGFVGGLSDLARMGQSPKGGQ